MSKVSIYLNFMGQTEEAFRFYKEVFGTDFIPGENGADMMYMKDIPADPSMPELSEEDANKVMHVALPILGGTQLMGTDMIESMGHELKVGNNININLQPDTRAETDTLFSALSDGASEVMNLEEMFWGDYFGSLQDKFGIHWMFNCEEKA